VSRTVMLDVEGTLVDGSEAEALAWLDAFHEAGFDHVSAETVRSLVGMAVGTLLPCAVGLSPNGAAGRRIVVRRRAIFTQRYLERVRRFPEVDALLRRMREDGFALFAVSPSGDRTEVEALLSVAGVGDLIDWIVPAEDGDPDSAGHLIGSALIQTGRPRQEAVMVGDTPYDLHAARDAGVGMIGLRSGGWNDLDLVGAWGIYNDPADLLARYSESPLSQIGRTATFDTWVHRRRRVPLVPW